ncbi:MAG: 30S ribosomal protein S12 methylthiotransferase RimO [Oscillospiraceae bacterium]|nr:30S ribosomal protein S12 methylthiotransferase RimO [Oscillospiraceae bacterium]
MADILLISLGCAKNQVNAEEMLHLLTAAGHKTVGSASLAQVAIVNTCGFIDAAKTEAIDHILEVAEHKGKGRLERIIVTGCLSQRYADEIFRELPEVDGVLGTGSYHEIVDAVAQVLQGEQVMRFGDIDAPLEERERVIVDAPGWAYLKIAEGCDNDCAYCVIPSLRGRFRSRSMESLLREARGLVAQGVGELILVAQDITQYGKDLYDERRLPALIRALSEIPGLRWIRLHYLYPDGIDQKLIRAIRDTKQVVPYLDIPIQHMSDTILTAMNRRTTSAEIRGLFETLRAEIPGLVLRTSLITGLPGEGEAELEELAQFLEETKIERVGVFPYSPQEGTPAAAMPNRPSLEEAERRAELLMDLQARILDRFNESRVGAEDIVLCIGLDPEAGLYHGRSYAESPEIDGRIWLDTEEELTLGAFYHVRYTDLQDGEIIGRVECPVSSEE